MAEFTAVIQQLAKNNEEERQRDSNMNQNIAFQSEQTRTAIQGMVQSITDGLASTKDTLVDAGEKTTNTIVNQGKADGGKAEEEEGRTRRLFQKISGGIGGLISLVCAWIFLLHISSRLLYSLNSPPLCPPVPKAHALQVFFDLTAFAKLAGPTF